MNMNFIRKLPIPQELKKQFSLSDELVAVKAARDAEIQKVFTGESDKKLLIIGPCSADREDAVLDYGLPSGKGAGTGQGQADSDSENLHQQAENHRRRL